MIGGTTLSDLLDATASEASTPGGGAIAAVSGALGAALGEMSCRYTLGPKYADRRHAVERLLAALADERARFLEIADLDVEAYGGFSDAMKMPRDTDEAKAARRGAMQAALAASMEVPLVCARSAARVLDLLVELAEVANPNLASDVGCAAWSAHAALGAARLNVLVNADSLKDAETAAAAVAEIEALRERGEASARTVLATIDGSFGILARVAQSWRTP